MTGEIRVDYPALTTAADQEVEAGEKVESIRTDHADATLEPGSLGKLPESDEIQAEFDDLHAKSGEALEALSKACEGLTDRLVSFRDYSRDLDDTVHQKFTTMQGGA